ncbi:MAG: FAD-binding protein, partial [Phycisphaerae bacterium]|nr:FAD-binding protein [Phycisphaerae bacterium]
MTCCNFRQIVIVTPIMDQPYLQRRYLLSFDSRDIGHIFTDVLVVGAGAAGLRAALASADDIQVLVLTKGDPAQSNTYQAQGGIAAVMADDDSIEAHIADTIACAVGLGDEEVIRRMVSRAPGAIAEMIEWGLPADTENGKVALGREGAHSADRIVHAHGDATGKHLAEMLIARA